MREVFSSFARVCFLFLFFVCVLFVERELVRERVREGVGVGLGVKF